MTRLIDADILKEAFIVNTDRKGNLVADPEVIIDNAPTVPLPDFKEGYKQAIRDGKTNFSRPHGEWIPVSERLPEVGRVVIVTDNRGKVFEYELYPSNVDKYPTGKWRFLEREIIAWQPLPKPYEEADNDTRELEK